LRGELGVHIFKYEEKAAALQLEKGLPYISRTTADRLKKREGGRFVPGEDRSRRRRGPSLEKKTVIPPSGGMFPKKNVFLEEKRRGGLEKGENPQPAKVRREETRHQKAYNFTKRGNVIRIV